jgi:hypothetical protein
VVTTKIYRACSDTVRHKREGDRVTNVTGELRQRLVACRGSSVAVAYGVGRKAGLETPRNQ